MATSYEHAPPKALFPEDHELPAGISWRKNLITVPSCSQHNSEKSNIDKLFLFYLLTMEMEDKRLQISMAQKLISVAQNDPTIWKEIRDLSEEVVVDGVIKRTMPVNYKVFDISIDHIARALYFKETKRKLTDRINYEALNFHFHKTSNAEIGNKYQNDMLKLTKELSKGAQYKGSNHKIFKYTIHIPDEQSCSVHMVFYESHHFVAWNETYEGYLKT